MITADLMERVWALMKGNSENGISGREWAESLGIEDIDVFEDMIMPDLGPMMTGICIGYILTIDKIEKENHV